MNKTLRTEIIAVGTELLLGQIANTNAQWISEQLASFGINTYFHTVVGDNLQRLTSIMTDASKRSNVIIVSGGLGPTEDDLSREAFQQISGRKIVYDEESLRKIEQFFKERNIPMTPNNRRQARVFENSIILKNKYGMAPGNMIEHDDIIWIFLPGVPREMKQIFSDEVLPYLRKLNGEQIIQSLVLRFIGIGESILEDRIKDLIANQDNPTIALLTDRDGITIRLTAKAKTKVQADEMLQQKKKAILDRVGEFHYGDNETTIEEVVFQLLKTYKKTIAAAESLTGGRFQNKFVSQSGVSEVFKGGIVSYATSVKEHVLNVSKETIEKYGTVSEQCAYEMAKNVANLMDADIGISFTGVAGPEKTENKEVGKAYVCVYDRQGYVRVEPCRFWGNRKQIRHQAALKGFELLFNYLKAKNIDG